MDTEERIAALEKETHYLRSCIVEYEDRIGSLELDRTVRENESVRWEDSDA